MSKKNEIIDNFELNWNIIISKINWGIAIIFLKYKDTNTIKISDYTIENLFKNQKLNQKIKELFFNELKDIFWLQSIKWWFFFFFGKPKG